MGESLFKQQSDGTIKHEKEINDLNTYEHAKACLTVEQEIKQSTTDYELFAKENLPSLQIFESIIKLFSKSDAKVLHAYSGRGIILDLLTDTFGRSAVGIEPKQELFDEYHNRCAQDFFIEECPVFVEEPSKFYTDEKFDLILVTPGILFPREKSSMRLAIKDLTEYTTNLAAALCNLQNFLTDKGFLVTFTQDFYAAKTFFFMLAEIQKKVEGALQLRGQKIYPKPMPFEKKQFLTDYIPLLNYTVAGVFTKPIIKNENC